MKIKILLLFLIIFFQNCMGLSYGAMIGAIPNTNPNKQYAHGIIIYKNGIIFHKTNSPGQALDAKLVKTGESCNHGILWLISFGDSSIQQAAKSAKITKIGSVDHEITSILTLLYQSNCTIVKGE